MKKRIIISFLGVISIILGLGGIAAAASPPENKPTEAWDKIVAGIDNILTAIGDLADDLTSIESKIDSQPGNVAQYTYLTGNRTLSPGYDELTFTNTNSQIRHVSLTAKGEALISLELYIKVGNEEIRLESNDGSGGNVLVYEFDAKEFKIKAFNHSGYEDYTYYYTVSYIY